MSSRMAAGQPRWYQVLRLPSMMIGITMSILLWVGVMLLMEVERRASNEAITTDTANMSRVFEENVIRSIREIDKSLLYLRQSYANDPANADWPRLIRQAFMASEITFQISIIDADGFLMATDRGPQPPNRVDLRDREHFRIHLSSPIDQLFISKPVLGRVTNQWAVQLTRRVTNSDGTLAGVIVASLDPGHFSEFYKSVDLGAGSEITLVGIDGIIRASGGRRAGELGSRFGERALLDLIRTEESGRVQFKDAATGTARIGSFRWVRGYPLVVIVATDEDQPSSTWLRNRRLYIANATLMTLLILGGVLLGTRRGMRLAEAQRQLTEKSRQLEVTLENITQGILMVDAKGAIGFLNNRYCELLGLAPDFASGEKTYLDLVAHLEAAGEFAADIEPALLEFIRAVEPKENIPGFERTRPDGTVLDVRTKPLPGGGFVRTLTDITGRRRAEAKILQLARHDGLTGLVNRAVFRQRLDEAARAMDTHPFAVHMIDLDRFKAANDTYGHLVGDKLLKEVADRLRQIIRSSDVAARLGGDEFAVIQMDADRQEQASALAARICRTLGQPYTIDGHTILIGASVGIAFAPRHSSDAQELLHAADLALYSAKSSCRGTFSVFREQMQAEHSARRALEADLRTAIAAEQFELHYQPITSIGSNQVTAYEALIRWHHPERGNVPPMEFIPLAEDSGLIGAIGAWVLRTACLEIAQRPGDARIAINLSPVQFRDPQLVDAVVKALEDSGLPPSRLEIEITETALLQDDQLTQQHLRSLRDIGVHVTMDDFGTGYSSLSYLMSYPIQSIKIDRSFVKGLGQQASCTAIVRTITTLAMSLGLSTTAEGVETAEQLELLRELGCTEAQGYFFSRPLPASQILPPMTAGTDAAAEASELLAVA